MCCLLTPRLSLTTPTTAGSGISLAHQPCTIASHLAQLLSLPTTATAAAAAATAAVGCALVTAATRARPAFWFDSLLLCSLVMLAAT